MAKVVAIGHPVNDAERQAIAHLRDHLSDSYTILHNFEIARDGESGRSTSRCWRLTRSIWWMSRGHAASSMFTARSGIRRGAPRTRPRLPSCAATRARSRASSLAANRHGKTCQGIYVDAAVVLTAPDAYLSRP